MPARARGIGTTPWALVALLGLAALVRLGVVVNAVLDPDESEHLQAAWLVSQGQVPFRDFWDHHAPLFYYLFAPLTRWLSESATVYVVGRAIMAGAGALTLLIVYRLARRLSGTVAVAAVGLLAFLPRFTEKASEVRPDPLALTAWLGALLAVVCWREQDRPAWLWRAGLALGTAVALNLKALYGLPALVGVIALAPRHGDPQGPRRRLGVVARFAAGAAVVPAAVVAWLAWSGGREAIEAAFRLGIVANLHFADFVKEKPVSDPGIGFLALAVGGLVLTLRGEGRRVLSHPLHGPLLASLVVIGGVLLLPATPGVARHAWLPVQAGLAVYAGITLAALAGEPSAPRSRRRTLLTALALVAGLLIPATNLTLTALRNANADQLRVMRAMLRDACPDEAVLDGVALAVFRPPAYRYRTLMKGVRDWIDTGTIPAQSIVADLRRTRPRVAYPDSRVLAVPLVARFVERHYIPGPDGLEVLGVALTVPASDGTDGAEVELLASGPYRVSPGEGLAIAIDGMSTDPGIRALAAGRHVLTWRGPAGMLRITAVTCAERRAAPVMRSRL